MEYKKTKRVEKKIHTPPLMLDSEQCLHSAPFPIEVFHWFFFLSFYYCSKPRLWQPRTRTRIALCWFIHLKCWLFPVNVRSISRAYPRHICSQTPFIPGIIIVCCVCVCVCVCAGLCGLWGQQICIITWVWQRYYNLKVFYEDTAMSRNSKGLKNILNGVFLKI